VPTIQRGWAGEKVRVVALELQPVKFDGDEPMLFHVYAVRDGDAEDEQFEEGLQPGSREHDH